MIEKKPSLPMWLSGLGAVTFLSGCKGVALLDPAGQVGMHERTLILIATLLMLIVVAPTIFLVLFFIWKYRASNTKSRYDPEWAYSRRIEATMWAVPFLIVAVLGTIAWFTTHQLDPFRPLESQSKPVTIQVVSLDWKWLFIYPDQDVASVNQVAFPSGVPVRFVITSASVMSSFFIPRLGSQIYSMAGMQTEVNLIADRPGSYDGFSSQFNGPGFAKMDFKALAVPDEEQFEAWLAAARASPKTLDSMAYKDLAAPSNSPVEYYSKVEPGLFHSIIASFMKGATGVDQGMNSMTAEGSDNVR